MVWISIRGVSRRDGGTYICIADNGAGRERGGGEDKRGDRGQKGGRRTDEEGKGSWEVGKKNKGQ